MTSDDKKLRRANSWLCKTVSTATVLKRSISSGKCMFGQHGTGLSLRRNVMNQLSLIKKSLCKKNLLHNAELFFSSRPSHSSSTELNIRLLKQKAKRNAIHRSELNLASKSSSSSSQLNSHLANKRDHEKRLHSAQIISIKRWYCKYQIDSLFVWGHLSLPY